MTLRLLDRTVEASVSTAVLDALDEGGYSAREAIPGLVRAIWTLAGSEDHTTQLLDEASDLLADGVDAVEDPDA